MMIALTMMAHTNNSVLLNNLSWHQSTTFVVCIDRLLVAMDFCIKTLYEFSEHTSLHGWR